MQIKEKVKIGLTGLGRIGKVHLENLVYRLPEAEVVAIHDVSQEALELMSDYGIPHHYTNFEDLLQHPEIKAVVICSPTFTHLEYIEMASVAGKQIFCEKPLEMTAEKINTIDEIVRKHGVKLQVGFNRRFDASFAKIKSLVDSWKDRRFAGA